MLDSTVPYFGGSRVRVSDLLARREVVEKVLADVCTFLEIDYPLGAEVYRDENGSIFIVPEADDLLQATVKGQTLLEVLEEIADTGFSDEARLKLEVSNDTRNMLILGELATSELPAPSAEPDWLSTIWAQSRPCDLCPVCSVRPQGPGKKALDRNVCDVCEQRRLDRSKNWATVQASTIWTDEVADESSRLALVVGAFPLEVWLSGKMLNSVMMFDPETRLLTDPKRSNITYQFDYQQLIADIQDTLKRKQFTGHTLLDRLVLQLGRGDGFSQFFDIQVIDSDLKQFAESGGNHADYLPWP